MEAKIRFRIDGVIFRDDFVCQEPTKTPHSENMNITAQSAKQNMHQKIAWSKFYSRETSTYYKSFIHIIHINSTIVRL